MNYSKYHRPKKAPKTFHIVVIGFALILVAAGVESLVGAIL